jgi:hypothetical protein
LKYQSGVARPSKWRNLLRVALFAQQVGTAYPVSVKRIDRIERIERRLELHE